MSDNGATSRPCLSILHRDVLRAIVGRSTSIFDREAARMNDSTLRSPSFFVFALSVESSHAQ